MKKEIGVLIFVFLVGFVVAGSCDDNDRIMRLSSGENAHGAVWNDAAYDYDICFNDIFGGSYELSGLQLCTGENKVLGLDGLTNAHAEIPSLDNYDIDVCYDSLRCTARDICLSDEEEVVSLSSESNAHLADVGVYPKKICCSIEPEVYWANMKGEKITNAEVGDDVMLVAIGAMGSRDFEIYEDDVFGDDEIRTGSNAIKGSSEPEAFSVIGYWKITEDDLANTPNDYSEFYFIVDVGGDWIESDYLDISPVADDSPTVFDFLSPACGEYFDVGSEIEISISVEDEDDLIEGNVYIEGEIIPFSNKGGKSKVKFNHTFVYPGNFQIVADAVDGDENRMRRTSSVMLVDTSSDGDYAAACIDSPEDFSNIETSEVWFDASNSLGIRRVGGVNNEVKAGDNNLKFYWTFSDGRTNTHVDGDDVLSYNFYKRFSFAGNNWAVLRVELV